MKIFDYGKVKDPLYFREDRLDAHSDHRFYADMDEMEMGESSFKVSLNGLWKFHYAKNYAQTVNGFMENGFDCQGWDDIYVPSNIQMEGYDIPQYANTQYPWEGHEEVLPGELPEKFNPVASYVKYFELPKNFVGKKVFVSFQGAESGIAVWLNGKYIGYSEDTFTPSEFELTEALVEGKNTLAVQVFKWTASSWCEDQDFFRFCGLYREVYLYAVPEVHVWDMSVRAIPEESLTIANLELCTKTEGEGQAKVTLSKDGVAVIDAMIALGEAEKVEWTIENPVLWSAEDPQLYDLLIQVYDKDEKFQEVISEKVGFRRFEMKGNLMLINGKRIVFKGVNRHEFSAVSGRAVSEAELLQDIITMKQNNINAIRTCHYPNVSAIYRLCDEYGLYMIDETNMETHGSWDTANDDTTYIVPHDKPEWLDMLLDRANSMYQRDKNHASIVIWSCGNESYGGKVIFEMSEFFRKVDPTRLVHYEGIFHDRSYNATSDMETQMYPTVAMIKEFLAKDQSKPFICCEYTHAMGNSCGGMHLYTDLTDEEPLYQGGFIWDYVDQSIFKKDRYGKEFQAYGGDFGDRPCDYNFSGNGIVYGEDRKPSPKMQEVKFNYQNITAEVSKDSVKVINKNLFTNTDVYDCEVTVEKEGKLVRKAALVTSVAPLSETVYELPVAPETHSGEYVITVSFKLKKDTLWAKAGHEVAFGQYVYEVEGVEEVCTAGVTLIKSAHSVGVRGEHFEAIFSGLNGGLVSYKYAGREMIEAIPKPNFWRAPVDNDMGSLMPMRYGQWKLASLYATHKNFHNLNPAEGAYIPEVEVKENSVLVTCTYRMPTTPESESKLAYEVFGDGTIKTTLIYDPVKELGDMPEFGVIFKFNADYNQVKWYGLGPAETYADRKRGAKLGVYENKVADNMAKYLVPQECGNKEEVRFATITDRKGRGMLFEMDKENGPMCFSALPYTPHEMENAAHPYELPEVHYTVVRVAKAQMGVGGDDSWGSRPLPQYLIPVYGKMEFSFKFKGI